MIITIPKILEDKRRCFCKNNRTGIPKNLTKYATTKNLIPLPTRDINIKPIARTIPIGFAYLVFYTVFAFERCSI